MSTEDLTVCVSCRKAAVFFRNDDEATTRYECPECGVGGPFMDDHVGARRMFQLVSAAAALGDGHWTSEPPTEGGWYFVWEPKRASAKVALFFNCSNGFAWFKVAESRGTYFWNAVTLKGPVRWSEPIKMPAPPSDPVKP